MRIQVKVVPKSSRRKVEWKDGVLKVWVNAAPEGGKANRAVIELLSKLLKVPKSSFSIISGETSRRKVIQINGVDEDYINEKLRKTGGNLKGV